MLVLNDDGEKYSYKLIACTLGSPNEFHGYHLTFQEAQDNNGTAFVLFQDYLYSSDLIRIDENTVYGPCCLVETNYKKHCDSCKRCGILGGIIYLTA